MNDRSDPQNQDQLTQRADIWSRYWKHGARHSCAGSFGSGYEGAIGAWWKLVFASLGANKRVLDLATGSGAVVRMGVEHCKHASVRFDGVDLGQTLPVWTLPGPPESGERVRFHGGVRIEALPFGAGSFDLITSQFGIEYADLAQAAAEVRRVLRPGGSVRFVMHHASSVPVDLAAAELELIAWLLAPAGLLQTAQQLTEPFARATTAQGRASLAADKSANLLRAQFNSLQDESRRLATGSRCPDVLQEASDAIAQAMRLAQTEGAEPATVAMQAYALQLQDASFRLTELRRHALSAASLAAFGAHFGQDAFSVSTGELRDETRLMGWWFKADANR
jgi:ubiquinone/menaquinone biosynthesis C-methylase UbiE